VGAELLSPEAIATTKREYREAVLEELESRQRQETTKLKAGVLGKNSRLSQMREKLGQQRTDRRVPSRLT